MERASAGSGNRENRGVMLIALLALAGAALLAVAAAALWLSGTPAGPERLEAMGCRELAAEILHGGEAERHAALEIFERKKCF